MHHLVARIQLPALLCVCVLAGAGAATPEAPTALPATPVRPVVDVYHGVEIVDPYRWLENLDATETQAWIRAQAEHAERHLHALPGRTAILDKLHRPVAEDTAIRSVQEAGGRWFYLRRAPGQNDFVLVMRERETAPERVLINPATLSDDDRRWSINGFRPSPDGTKVAYLVSEGGREDPDTRVFDIQAGRDTGLRIERTWYAEWLPDGSGLFSTRLPRGQAATRGGGRTNQTTHLHLLGSDDAEADRRLLGSGVDPRVPMQPIDYAIVTAPLDTGLVVARIQRGVDRHAAFYVAPLASLSEATIPWRRLVDHEDQVAEIALHEDALFLLSGKDAPNYRVLRTSLRRPDVGSASVVVPEGPGVVQAIVASADSLYVQTSVAGPSVLSRYDHAGKRLASIAQPEGSSLSLLGAGTQRHRTDVHYSRSGILAPPSWHRFDAEEGRSHTLALSPPSAVNRDHIEVRLGTAPSHDGVEVPVVVLHRKGIELDGRHPTVLVGYGAYGMTLLEPANWPDRSLIDAWIDQGFVLAVAGVRGGGEYGRAWHLAGKEATKANSWRDLIAVGEWLIQEGYTVPARLAASGGSAGGILVGNAIAERPELFAAALIDVGWSNTLRLETTTNGPGNIPEFGSVATKAGFEALLAMDAFHKLRDGVAYPAVLLNHGYNDPRVDVWFSAKMAARLQAASGSGEPVLLSVDYDAGHGHGNSRGQQRTQLANEIAFLVEQLAPETPKSP